VPKIDKLLQYCTEPRTAQEITAHLGFKTIHGTISDYVHPLIKQGKLFRTVPNCHMCKEQKYTTENPNIPPLTEETLKEFCHTPHTGCEIAEYFGIPKTDTLLNMIQPFVANGILMRAHPQKQCGKKWRFVTVADNA
jgi:hypothetical protein